jgi:hypothetical protein
MKISEIIVEQGEMSVEKDDDNETVLVDKTKGTKTVIDKKNPSSPKITQDQSGKLSLDTDAKDAGKKTVIPAGTKVAIKQ